MLRVDVQHEDLANAPGHGRKQRPHGAHEAHLRIDRVVCKNFRHRVKTGLGRQLGSRLCTPRMSGALYRGRASKRRLPHGDLGRNQALGTHEHGDIPDLTPHVVLDGGAEMLARDHRRLV